MSYGTDGFLGPTEIKKWTCVGETGKVCSQIPSADPSRRLTGHKDKAFFTVRVVRDWHRLPREEVDAPPLAILKVRLNGALST